MAGAICDFWFWFLVNHHRWVRGFHQAEQVLPVLITVLVTRGWCLWGSEPWKHCCESNLSGLNTLLIFTFQREYLSGPGLTDLWKFIVNVDTLLKTKIIWPNLNQGNNISSERKVCEKTEQHVCLWVCVCEREREKYVQVVHCRLGSLPAKLREGHHAF